MNGSQTVKGWTAVVALFAVGTLAVAVAALGTAEADEGGRGVASQRNYVLGCGGCHGVDGVSNSTLVPELRNQVGYFLNERAGREYLVRVPNVAFYTASDQELADMLNYVVFQLGGTSVPATAKPYSRAEVAALRKRPFTEISLVDYRKELIAKLAAHHPPPADLSVYGSDKTAAR